MSTRLPLASVVIPTHNRRDSVCRTIAALGRQTCASERFEIIVAADGARDGTVDAVRSVASPSNLRVLDLPPSGAAAARNAGARVARGGLLIFLDDDIDVSPEFVEAHLEAHGIAESAPETGLPLRVAVGYLPAVLQPETDLFATALRGWWEAMFDRMREPGHRFAYTDLLTGNFSIPRASFAGLGGFDERYVCHEDYEFGYRLILAGATFVFAERARGHHSDLTRLPRACARKREEGRADVLLATQYPDLRPVLLAARRRSRKQRFIRRIIFVMPRVGDRLAALLAGTLPVLERVGARASWARVLYALFGYWYDRGAAEVTGSPAALRSLFSGVSARDEPEDGIPLDVSDLDAAEQQLDEQRPEAVRLYVGSRAFGRIASQPGAERLAGRHLRPTLTRIWHRAYVEALLAEDRFPLLAAPAASASPQKPEPVAVDPIGLLTDPAPPRPGR